MLPPEESVDSPAIPPGLWVRLPAAVRDLVTVLILASFGQIPFGGQPAGAVLMALLIGQAVAVVLVRRRWPVMAVGLAVGFFVVATAIGPPNPALTLPVAVAIYSVAAKLDRRLSVISAAVTIALLVVSFLLLAPTALLDPRAVSVATIVAAAAALGDAARSRRDYILAITERAVRAERSRESEAQRRVAEDRLRTARDLHDVVAHQIAVINLHAGVASTALPAQPETAQESLQTIRQAARAVLDEIGDLMAMLRTTTPAASPAGLAPSPSLSQLEELLSQFETAGLPVITEIDGDLVELSPAVGVVAYRAIQEGLTNAHKHGRGASATLTIHRTAGWLKICVSNQQRLDLPVTPGSGRGLQGIRERVESVRGTTRVESSPDGRFVLSVDIPLEGGRPDRAQSGGRALIADPERDPR